MAIQYVDTDRVKEISKNIIYLSNRYDVLINKLFKRMTLVPYDTKEWVGQTAERYFKYVSLDKADFLKFSDKIREYGKRLSDDAEAIEDKVSKNVAIERKGKNDKVEVSN